jgi:hypothetical protein
MRALNSEDMMRRCYVTWQFMVWQFRGSLRFNAGHSALLCVHVHVFCRHDVCCRHLQLTGQRSVMCCQAIDMLR